MMSPSEVFYETNGWAYDQTLGFAVALVWWLSEYFSLRSQKDLYYAGEFNTAWSILSCLLVVVAAFSCAFEQFLRQRYELGVPTTIATILAASLSYVLVPERFRIFDANARLVERLLRADKLRFGKPGTKDLRKYVIVWFRLKKGDPEYTWDELHYTRRKDEQILVDWGVLHRMGNLSNEKIAEAVRKGDDEYMSVVGSLLYFWLPGGSFEHVKTLFKDVFRPHGRLKHGYKGSKGRSVGCNVNIEFETWLSEAKEMHFKLLAMEYPMATKMLVGELSSVARKAETAHDAAVRLLELWEAKIRAAKKSKPRRGKAEEEKRMGTRDKPNPPDPENPSMTEQT